MPSQGSFDGIDTNTSSSGKQIPSPEDSRVSLLQETDFMQGVIQRFPIVYYGTGAVGLIMMCEHPFFSYSEQEIRAGSMVGRSWL